MAFVAKLGRQADSIIVMWCVMTIICSTWSVQNNFDVTMLVWDSKVCVETREMVTASVCSQGWGAEGEATQSLNLLTHKWNSQWVERERERETVCGQTPDRWWSKLAGVLPSNFRQWAVYNYKLWRWYGRIGGDGEWGLRTIENFCIHFTYKQSLTI